jgi:predicted phosphodiesterase
VFGHSHIPYLDRHQGVILFNPGSADRPYGGRPPTIGLITAMEPGAAPRLEHIQIK